MTETKRRGMTLAEAAREFWRHPTPWLLSTAFVGAVIARVAVGDGRQDRPGGGQVLVGLPGHDRRSAAGGKIVHRQEEQVGRAQELDRLRMRKVAVQAGAGCPLRHAVVCVGQHAGKVQLHHLLEGGRGRGQLLERLHEMDV